MGLEDRKLASSEESVGDFWLGKPAEHVIQREFGDPERPIAVRCSQCDFGFVVQTLDDAAGELLFGSEVVEQQLPVRAHGAGKLLHRIDARAHRSLAPGIEELFGPGRRVVFPEQLELNLSANTPERFSSCRPAALAD